MDDLAGHVAQRVAGNVGPATQEALQRVIEDALAEHADRLINALAVGLGTAMAAVTGRPVDDDLIDRLADQMREAYEYQRDGEDGGAGETDEHTGG
jgi:DNA-binding GntR family transcriptional regulator